MGRSGEYSGVVNNRDNVNIAFNHSKQGFDSVIIICPGFLNSKNNIWMIKAVDMFIPRNDVIIFDFRGHGESGGKFSWSAKVGNHKEWISCRKADTAIP